MNRLVLKLLRDMRSMLGFILAIALLDLVGVMIFGSALGTDQNLEASFEDSYQKLALADLWFQLRNPISQSVVEQVRQVPGVGSAAGRLSGDLPVEEDMGSGVVKIVGHLMALPKGMHPPVNDFRVVAGDYPSKGDEILVERNSAEFHGLAPGNEVLVVGPTSRQRLRVAGIFTSPEYIFVMTQEGLRVQDFAALLVPRSTVAHLLRADEDSFNEVLVTTKPTADLEQVRGRLEEVLATYGLYAVKDRGAQISYAFVKMQLAGLRQLAIFFPILFLMVASLSTYALLNRLVHEQRSQIGLMRALGVSAVAVHRYYLAFALTIGLIGAIPGSVGAIYLNGVLTRTLLELTPAPIVVMRAPWGTILIAVALSLVFTGLAGWYPAHQAASIVPLEAMKLLPAANTTTQRYGWIRLEGLPTRWRVPLRNLFRQRGRSIGTAIGVAFAEIFVLISAAYFNSVSSATDYEYRKVKRYNAKVSFTQPLSEQEVGDLLTSPEVLQFTPVVEVPVRLELDGQSYSTLLLGLPSTDLFRLYDMRERPVQLTSTGVLLGSGLRKALPLTVGSRVKLFSPFGEFNTQVADFVYQIHGSYAYLPLEEARQRFEHLSEIVTGALLLIKPDRLKPAIDSLDGLPEIANVQTVADDLAYFKDQIASFNLVVSIMAAFGSLMALIILFNTSMLNVLERRKELATMRMLGTRRGEITAMVTLEAILGGLLGVLPGVLVGDRLARFFFSQFGGEQTTFLVKIFPWTYALVVIGSLFVLLLAQCPGLRYVGRLNLARVAKEQVT